MGYYDECLENALTEGSWCVFERSYRPLFYTVQQYYPIRLQQVVWNRLCTILDSLYHNQ